MPQCEEHWTQRPPWKRWETAERQEREEASGWTCQDAETRAARSKPAEVGVGGRSEEWKSPGGDAPGSPRKARVPGTRARA